MNGGSVMKRIWDAEELATCWSLTFDELQLLKTKPPRTHLGFAIQLKHYQLNFRRHAQKINI
jgi:hypothetical protein